MRHRLSTSALFLVCLVLNGCSAVGVIESSDPKQKLADAYALIEQGRATAAERLIFEAIDICNEKGEALCLASAYRIYGLLLSSNSVATQWAQHYRSVGFKDSSVSLENRYSKTVEYFNRARDIYVSLEVYDAVSNLELNAGFIHEHLGEATEACQAYDASLDAQLKNQAKNPASEVILPEEYGTFENYIAIQKNRVPCGDM